MLILLEVKANNIIDIILCLLALLLVMEAGIDGGLAPAISFEESGHEIKVILVKHTLLLSGLLMDCTAALRRIIQVGRLVDLLLCHRKLVTEGRVLSPFLAL